MGSYHATTGVPRPLIVPGRNAEAVIWLPRTGRCAFALNRRRSVLISTNRMSEIHMVAACHVQKRLSDHLASERRTKGLSPGRNALSGYIPDSRDPEGSS